MEPVCRMQFVEKGDPVCRILQTGILQTGPNSLHPVAWINASYATREPPPPRLKRVKFREWIQFSTCGLRSTLGEQ